MCLFSGNRFVVQYGTVSFGHFLRKTESLYKKCLVPPCATNQDRPFNRYFAKEESKSGFVSCTSVCLSVKLNVNVAAFILSSSFDISSVRAVPGNLVEARANAIAAQQKNHSLLRLVFIPFSFRYRESLMSIGSMVKKDLRAFVDSASACEDDLLDR